MNKKLTKISFGVLPKQQIEVNLLQDNGGIAKIVASEMGNGRSMNVLIYGLKSSIFFISISVNDKPIQTASTPIVKPKPPCMTKSRGNIPPKPCKFPFKLNNGNVHDSCTTDQDPDGKLWCSTKVNSNGDHVRGHWGYCGENCQTDTKPVDNSPVDNSPVDNSIIRFVITY